MSASWKATHRIGGEASQAGAALLDAVRDALASAMTPLRKDPMRGDPDDLAIHYHPAGLPGRIVLWFRLLAVRRPDFPGVGISSAHLDTLPERDVVLDGRRRVVGAPGNTRRHLRCACRPPLRGSTSHRPSTGSGSSHRSDRGTRSSRHPGESTGCLRRERCDRFRRAPPRSTLLVRSLGHHLSREPR